jgi:hypothetical protein
MFQIGEFLMNIFEFNLFNLIKKATTHVVALKGLSVSLFESLKSGNHRPITPPSVRVITIVAERGRPAWP